MRRLGIWLRYAAMRGKVRLQYRGDFLVGALGDLLISGIGLIFLWAVFERVPDIRGYGFHEILLVWGLAEASTGLFFVLFRGLWFCNQRYILQGEMDRVLLRPLNPYGQMLADNVSLQDLPIFLLGMAMVAASLGGLPPVDALDIILLGVFVASAVLILAGLLTAVSAIGFRIHHRGTAIGLVYQGSVFGRYPIDIYHRWLQVLLTFVVPFGFIAFFPATWLMEREGYRTMALVQPVVGVVLMLAGYHLWMRALQGYRSTGT